MTTTPTRCATIGCGADSTHLLTYTFPESRNELETSLVCLPCGLGYLRRPTLKATLTTIPPERCDTCNSDVHADACLCWTHVADALERYLGYDFDRSADVAKDMWCDLPIAHKQFVWSGQYGDTHDTAVEYDLTRGGTGYTDSHGTFRAWTS